MPKPPAKPAHPDATAPLSPQRPPAEPLEPDLPAPVPPTGAEAEAAPFGHEIDPAARVDRHTIERNTRAK
jgi:hypothetical protein